MFTLSTANGTGAIVSQSARADVRVTQPGGATFIQTITLDAGTKLLVNPPPNGNKAVVLATETRLTITVQDSKGVPVESTATLPAGTIVGINPLTIPPPKAAPVLNPVINDVIH